MYIGEGRDREAHIDVCEDMLEVNLPLPLEALHRVSQLAPQPAQVPPVEVIQIHVVRKLDCSWGCVRP